MKTRIALLVLACLIAAGPVSGQDSTRKGRSWRPWTPYRNLHIDLGLGRVPYLDQNAAGKTAVEVKLVSPVKWLPDWSIGVASSSVLDPERTSYVAPETVTPAFTGIHPELISTTIAFELQRRWDQQHTFHPIAAADVGGLMNTYSYYENGNVLHEHGKRWIPYGQVAFGGEFKISAHVRPSFLLGYRSGGRMKIEQAAGSNGGATMMVNLQLGKF